MTNDTQTNQAASTALPSIREASVMMRGALGQIRFARDYTLQLLEATPKDRWFEIPDGHCTHIAWQVGHLTVSQYGLLMFRVRGRQPEDLQLIPGKFRKAYGRQSSPVADAACQPSADELLQRMTTVYDRALGELESIDPAALNDPIDMPYAAYPTKLGAILFCPMHETIHAGQIGLLRRGLGLEPVR
tara:strand:- start:38701 stop:39264 length:564 start_codon:yes stop_codon:yes gene_type:complete